MTSDPDVLREVELAGHRLVTWDTGRTDWRGQSVIGYQLFAPDGGVVFEGEDFAGSPMHAIDSDATLRSLITFLSLRPGDTDDEYFEDYDEDQLDWADEWGETLSMWSDEDYGQTFKDLREW